MAVNIVVGRSQKDISSLSIALLIDELLQEQKIETVWIDLPDHPRSEFSLLENVLSGSQLNVLVVQEDQLEAVSATGDLIASCRSSILKKPLAPVYVSAERGGENIAVDYLNTLLKEACIQPFQLLIDRVADAFDEKLDIQNTAMATSVEAFVYGLAEFCRSSHADVSLCRK
jgi:hypothetical protein